VEIEWHKPIVRALKTQKREAENVRTASVFLGPETCFAILRVKVGQHLLYMLFVEISCDQSRSTMIRKARALVTCLHESSFELMKLPCALLDFLRFLSFSYSIWLVGLFEASSNFFEPLVIFCALGAFSYVCLRGFRFPYRVLALFPHLKHS